MTPYQSAYQTPASHLYFQLPKVFLNTREAIERYMTWKATYAPRAAQSYPIHLYRMAKKMPLQLKDIRLDHVIEYLHIVKNTGSEGNYVFIQNVIKNFFSFWLKQGEISFDPSLIKIQRVTYKSYQPITEEEFRRLYALADDIRKKIALNVLWYTGIRISELVSIDISAIDLTDCKALIETRKAHRHRWICWPKEVNDLIADYIEHNYWIETTKLMRGISMRQIQRWLTDLIKQAGVQKRITCHSFRHAKAHRILDKGGTVKDVQMILGHSEVNPSASFRYLRLNSREMRQRALQFF